MDWLTWGDVAKLSVLGTVGALLLIGGLFAPLIMYVIAETNRLKAEAAFYRAAREPRQKGSAAS